MTMRGTSSLHNRFAEEMVGSVAVIVLVDTLRSLHEQMGGASAAILANVKGLARVADAFGVPVVLSLRDGRGPACGPIASAVPPANIFVRTGMEVLSDRPTKRAMGRLRRRLLFLAMWGRDEDVLAAALEAQRGGFDVRIVLDACWTADDPGAAAIAARLVAAGVELTTWVAVVAALSQDYAADHLPGHIRRAIAENLLDYAPALPTFRDPGAGIDRAEIF